MDTRDQQSDMFVMYLIKEYFSPEMMSVLRVSKYVDCQGNKSLNQYVKNFHLMCRTPTWLVPTWLETCPKVGP